MEAEVEAEVEVEVEAEVEAEACDAAPPRSSTAALSARSCASRGGGSGRGSSVAPRASSAAAASGATWCTWHMRMANEGVHGLSMVCAAGLIGGRVGLQPRGMEGCSLEAGGLQPHHLTGKRVRAVASEVERAPW